MADAAAKKASLKLGHWVALGSGAAGVILLLLQMLFALLSKLVTGSTKVLSVVETLVLLALLAGAVMVLLMTLKNPRLRPLVYAMAAAVFFLEQSAARDPLQAAWPFFIQTAVLALIAGSLTATGMVALPTTKDLHEAAAGLHGHPAVPPRAAPPVPPAAPPTTPPVPPQA